jgi:ATP-dependent DNA ligase
VKGAVVKGQRSTQSEVTSAAETAIDRVMKVARPVPPAQPQPAVRLPLKADRQDRAPRGIWVEPSLLAEIEYRAKSAAGKVRHPFFKGIREDL